MIRTPVTSTWPTNMSWQHFHHGADIGIRGIASHKSTAFEQAALAMTAVITEPETIEPLVEVSIRCEAPDDEVLLVDWLNALIYAMATRKMLFSRFEVRIDTHELRAKAWGQALDRQRHHPAVEVKGATFTELKVAQLDNGDWLAQCVVDV